MAAQPQQTATEMPYQLKGAELKTAQNEQKRAISALKQNTRIKQNFIIEGTNQYDIRLIPINGYIEITTEVIKIQGYGIVIDAIETPDHLQNEYTQKVIPIIYYYNLSSIPF